MLASRFSKQYKIISHIHQDPSWFNKLNIRTIAYVSASNKFSKIIFVSRKTFEDYFFKSIINKKAIVIHNAVDIKNIIKLSTEKIDSKFDLSYVGRLESVKNPEVFIDLVSRLKQKNKAIMVGAGSLHSALEVKIHKLGLENNVTLIGFSENPYKYLTQSRVCVILSKNEGFSLVAIEAADIFIFPSFREGLPVSLMEAMAAGLPIIASKTRGNTDLIDDGVNGYLFKPTESNDDDLVRILKLLITDKKIQKNFVTANLKKVSLFSQIIVKKYMYSIYSSL